MTVLELYAWYGSPIVAFLACYVLYLIARQRHATSAEKVVTSAKSLGADIEALAAELEKANRQAVGVNLQALAAELEKANRQAAELERANRQRERSPLR
jgi:hypothetical protein